MAALRITYGDLCHQLNSIDDAVRWCQQKGLLPKMKVCVCGQQCRIVNRQSYPEKKAFRCPRKGCQKVVSLRTGTFFENSNLPLEKVLRMLHLWSTTTPLINMRMELEVR